MASIEGLKSSNSIISHMITVSSGFLTFTVTFAEKFMQNTKDHRSLPFSLLLCWAFLLLSIISSLWTLMATTGTLNQIDAGQAEGSGKRTNIKWPAMAALATFFVSLMILAIAGWNIVG